MKIYSISGLNSQYSCNTEMKKRKYNAPAMTGNPLKNKKSTLFEHFTNYIKSKLSQRNQNYVKEVQTNITKILPATRPIEAQNARMALDKFISDPNFRHKVLVKHNNGSSEIFFKQFDAYSHETRINADYYDYHNKLHHTTVYDENGLMLSQYFVKFNNPKDPISIRRKDFNVAGKIVHEEIKYKNGDVTNVDYDYERMLEFYETKHPDGSYDQVTSSKYYYETKKFDKLGNEISHNVINY